MDNVLDPNVGVVEDVLSLGDKAVTDEVLEPLSSDTFDPEGPIVDPTRKDLHKTGRHKKKSLMLVPLSQWTS